MVFRAAVVKEMKEMDIDNFDNNEASQVAKEKWSKMSDAQKLKYAPTPKKPAEATPARNKSASKSAAKSTSKSATKSASKSATKKDSKKETKDATPRPKSSAKKATDKNQSEG